MSFAKRGQRTEARVLLLGANLVTSPAAIHSELLNAIKEPKVRKRVTVIIELCTQAVKRLDGLDQELHHKPSSGGQGAAQPVHERDSLELLSCWVLEGVRALDAHLDTLDVAVDEDENEEETSESSDFEFDLGGGLDEPDAMTLDDFDIDGALDGLAPQKVQSQQDAWKELSGEISSLAYALSSQLRDFDSRFNNALEAGRYEQGLRDIDGISNSLIDGVFALMSTICEAYLGEFDRDRLLPGHRDALGKALLVRRGLAKLRHEVNDANSRIQDVELADNRRERALVELAVALSTFEVSEVFAAMRSPDRLELNRFQKNIANHGVAEVLFVCEGLDKYLDSLVAVNQRDVLIKHDHEVMLEVADILESVPALIDISPHGAMDMVRQGFAKAAALEGCSDAIDEILMDWRDDADLPPTASRFALMGSKLAALMQVD